eukprot:gnl/TRDRNA2_/TRDRNA2_156148_c1_seq1.p1 gnl/TRDRNA2_/TRDRNA2_156148_c1~~gnl/TRDRNA2_/TRDRNA2_156148_c1_seq1.p1  ORF type:complete len:291 (+),score=31.83 gnl/TRDRNA2_/TRDRNA2_156148_c1_seq1:2-874(+)
MAGCLEVGASSVPNKADDGDMVVLCRDGGPSIPASDMLPICIVDMTFKYDNKTLLADISIAFPQGKLVAIVGSTPRAGRSTLLRLLGQSGAFATSGLIFVPTHLRVLHLCQEPVMLRLSAYRNLTFGRQDADPARVRAVVKELHIRHIEPLLTQKQNEDDHDWRLQLTYTDRAKMHLARALIMNPEVLVLQRPLHHYDRPAAKLIFEVIKKHVQLRGIALPTGSLDRRRPRTCFFAPEEADEALASDYIWKIDQQNVVVDAQHDSESEEQSAMMARTMKLMQESLKSMNE